MKGRSVIGGAIALLLLATGATSAAFAQDALQPYRQLVRSLQLIQDRIAGGDHAALPMQAKLLEMIDARIRDANAEDFKEPKNFRALLVYGMSGGNPVTVATAASRAMTDPQSLRHSQGRGRLSERPAGRGDRHAQADRSDERARRHRRLSGAGQGFAARGR
ncbi:hypothetical protein ACVOMV_00160 [Mesorhizobium atlanticum]